MDDFLNMTTNWWFWVPLLVVLLGLVGLMVFLRMKKKDEDE